MNTLIRIGNRFVNPAYIEDVELHSRPWQQDRRSSARDGLRIIFARGRDREFFNDDAKTLRLYFEGQLEVGDIAVTMLADGTRVVHLIQAGEMSRTEQEEAR